MSHAAGSASPSSVLPRPGNRRAFGGELGVLACPAMTLRIGILEKVFEACRLFTVGRYHSLYALRLPPRRDESGVIMVSAP
jgi:hypothetical protein